MRAESSHFYHTKPENSQNEKFLQAFFSAIDIARKLIFGNFMPLSHIMQTAKTETVGGDSALVRAAISPERSSIDPGEPGIVPSLRDQDPRKI